MVIFSLLVLMFVIICARRLFLVQTDDVAARDSKEKWVRSLPLIVDGSIEHTHLQRLNKNEFWLRQQLRRFGYRDIKNISYCTMKGKNRFFVAERIACHDKE
ncbi:YetF domain-containing protein [Shouchella lonarensis]|uniref:YetF C-terminal domain-containing protein n=1 Tax=Shouchella lonarensis TaxID=1464122 RepID=A0A1G6JPX8_9BACI|nr:YetF domain-containing protein [Shouchella lonarensis]SDC20738.1 hypothetical protein SAMN05421737_10656 [Shouchella lonarensis]